MKLGRLYKILIALVIVFSVLLVIESVLLLLTDNQYVSNVINESNGAPHGIWRVLRGSLVFTAVGLIALIRLLLHNVKKIQLRLLHIANCDVLTGLPNRQYLMSYLSEAKIYAQKHDRPFAFMLLDLDDFKRVNDGAGHDAGDEFLRNFADYLNSFNGNIKILHPPTGTQDVSVRIGGDEFVYIAHRVQTEKDVKAIATKLLDNFNSENVSPYVSRFGLGLSIGISLFPSHSDNYTALIKYADIAMYHAKSNGKHNYCIYNDGLVQPEPGSCTMNERRLYRRKKPDDEDN